MRWQQLASIATLGSVALMAGAYGFQHLGDLAPCKMCLWQRWPHAAAIFIGVILLATQARPLALLGAAAAATTSGIGLYHVGVEQKWWEGPNTCTAGSTQGLTPSELLDNILAAPVVRCDEIAWEFLGVSMAGWNGIISGILVLFWLAAFLRR